MFKGWATIESPRFLSSCRSEPSHSSRALDIRFSPLTGSKELPSPPNLPELKASISQISPQRPRVAIVSMVEGMDHCKHIFPQVFPGEKANLPEGERMEPLEPHCRRLEEGVEVHAPRLVSPENFHTLVCCTAAPLWQQAVVNNPANLTAPPRLVQQFKPPKTSISKPQHKMGCRRLLQETPREQPYTKTKQQAVQQSLHNTHQQLANELTRDFVQIFLLMLRIFFAHSFSFLPASAALLQSV